MPRSQVRVLTAVTAMLASSALMVGTAGTASAAPTPVSQTFSYTGSTQNFTVPAGITELTVTLTGAEGGRGGQDGAVGTAGGYKGVVSGTVPVTPGTVLSIGVGGGGQNGLQRAGASNNVTTPAGTNPVGGYAGGVGGTAGPDGASGNGGGGGAATVVSFGSTTLVAGGAGGGGGSGQFIPITGRPGEATPTPRTDTVSTSGQPGADTQPFCGGGRCDGGASGGGGGGAVGGARGLVEFGAGTNTEYFGYGGYPGTSATGGISSLSAVYQNYAGNNAAGSVVIAYVTGSPAAPTAVAGTAGNGSVFVNWTAPTATGGAAVSDYVVEYSSNGGTSWTTFTDGTSTATSTTVTGLTNGTAYVFRISAVNSFGTGTPSANSAPVTPSDVPTAPTLGTVVRGNGSLTVPFSGATAASPVTGYEYSVDGGPWIATGSTTSPLTVTGLTNGTTYGVQVRAVNAIGAGASSAPATGTPATTPGAPSITTATTGPTSAVLTFSPGASGGSAVTGYEYSLDGGAWVNAGTTTSPITVTGLSDGTLYAARIRAVNALGAGAASNPVNLTTSNVPGAPTIDAIAPLDGALGVSFTPSSTGGLSITGYEYSLDGGSWTAAGSTASPLLITGLTNGTGYGVRIRAVNGVGSGTASATSTGTPRTVPSAPTLTSSTAAGADLEIAFTAPTSTGGSAITGYEYSTDGGATWRARATGTTGSPLTISTLSSDGSTPLTGGTDYPIELRAVNAAGAGAASSILSASGRSAPSAPTIATVAGRPSALLVTVTPPANGGAEITGYEYRVDGGSWTATGTSGPSFVIPGLTNGTSYGVQVRATNTLGTGPASASVSGTPVAAPGAAVITDVAPIDRALRITATVADTGGSAVTGWEYTTDGGTTWAAGGGSSPFTVTHLSSNSATLLDNAASYSVAVRARNAVGAGGASATVSAAPSATPSVPTVTLTPGNGRLQVAYTIGSDGGSPLTDVQYRLDGGAWIGAGTITSPFVVSGLTNGTAYAVELRGVNSRGEGAVSSVVSGTPRTVPGAPTAVTAASENASTVVSWTAPASTGGSSVTGYTATAWSAPNGGTALGSCTAAGTTCTISGLTNGTAYYVAVVATNVAGNGPASSPRTTITPLARPSAPTLTSVTPNNTFVTAAFTAGAAGSSAITGYQYQLNGGAWVNAAGTSSPITISGLTNGTAYDIALRAVSAAGPGATSNVLNAIPYTFPDVPNYATITPNGANGSVTLNWGAVNGNGRPVTAYGVQLWNAATLGSFPFSCTTTGATSCTISGLTNGVVYYATVDATNLAGTTARSNPRVPVAAGTAPSAPTTVTGTAGDGQVALTWTAGAAGTGAPVSDYAVSYSSDGVNYTTFADGVSTNRAATVTGLNNGTAYTFKVTALSPSGSSPASAASAAVTPSGTGTVPTFGAVTRTATGFTAPISNYNAAVTYTATASAGTATVSGSTVTVTGLAAGASSTATVTATRTGYTTVSGTVSGTALLAGTAPTFGPVTRTATGWTTTITNADAAVTYTAAGTAGTTTISGNTVTVTGLAPAAASDVTVTATRTGYTTTTGTVSGTALAAGVAPTFGPVTRTVDGYTVEITNLDGDTTYGLTTSGTASATLVGSTLTVTGLAPGASSTVTVVAARPGSTVASAPVTGAALVAGIAPTFGPVTRLVDGYRVAITDVDPDATYSVVSGAGTAVVAGGVVTVSGLTPGQTTEVTVTVTKPGSVTATGSTGGTALETGTAPVLSEPIRTADGFTVAIADPDPAVTYTATSTAGTAAVDADGRVTVTGLTPGQTATVTVTATRDGFTTETTDATGVALQAGTTPELTDAVRTSDGFTLSVVDPDPAVTYSVTSDNGAVTLVDGLVTVTELAPGETASVTVTATRAGYTTTSADGTGAALETGTTPDLTDPVRTVDGFTTTIVDPDPAVTYTAVTTAGTVTVADGVVTVTGLTPGQTAEVIVTGTRTGYTTANTVVSAAALNTGTAAVFADPVRTTGGFTVALVQPDPAVTYTAASTAGTATIVDGVVTVTGLAPGQTATVTVTATRDGYTTATSTVDSAALRTGTAPELSEAVRTVNGFTVEILDDVTDPVTTYTATSTAGAATVTDGLVTVSGLAPGQTATVTVTATRDGYTTTTAAATGVALAAGTAPVLSAPTRTETGFTVTIGSPDPAVSYTAVSSVGTATVVNGVVTVTGLAPGQAATVTVTATRPGYTTRTSATTAAALDTGTSPVLASPVRTADGFTVGLVGPDPAVTYTAVSSVGSATLSGGTVTVTGLTPGQTATVTVTATRPGYTTRTAAATGTALNTGTAPVLSDPVRTTDGFVVTITDGVTDPVTTYTAGTTEGTVTVDGRTVTVAGLSPDQSATITVTATRAGFTSPSSTTTGTALTAGTTPITGTPTRTTDGFTFPVTNVDPTVTYLVTTTAGIIDIVDGIVTVTGLQPGETAEVTVTATKDGVAPETTTVVSGALFDGITPTVPAAPTRTVDGFAFAIADPVEGTTYTATSTAGTVTVVDGIVTVTGLAPGETATVTVTASRDGDTPETVTVTGSALETGTATVLSAPTPVEGGFRVTVVDPDADTVYTVLTSAGTVTIVDGVIVVTGLTPGQSAVLTVTATRPGYTTTTVTTTGAAPAAPELTLTGGGEIVATTSTPVISGVADAPAGSLVTVRVNGQTLTTTVGADGTWSVTPAALPDGEYDVVVSITVLGVTTTLTQKLTVDTPAPTTPTTPTGNGLPPVIPPTVSHGPGGLAYTGTDTRVPGAIGTGLLVLGALILGLARRRRPETASGPVAGSGAPPVV